jgi:hypothetical protein
MPLTRIRRGETVRRGAHDRLPPSAGRRHLHRADLQHLRALHSLHDGRAIPTFMLQALENKPLNVFGDGSQTRSVLLRRRPHPRPLPPRHERRAPVRQYGQASRDDAPQAGRNRRQGNRPALGNRLRGAAQLTIRRFASQTPRGRAKCLAQSPRSSLRKTSDA